jgi:DNA-binding NtrC family response regulator
MKPNIMFVDYNEAVLEALKIVFEDEPYHLCAFINPMEALNEIQEKEFAVVVAEQSIPEMRGIGFLEEVKAYSPNTIGMVMSVFREIQVPLEVLNNGLVYRCIKKPLDNADLKQAVKMAVTHYELNCSEPNLV